MFFRPLFGLKIRERGDTKSLLLLVVVLTFERLLFFIYKKKEILGSASFLARGSPFPPIPLPKASFYSTAAALQHETKRLLACLLKGGNTPVPTCSIDYEATDAAISFS